MIRSVPGEHPAVRFVAVGIVLYLMGMLGLAGFAQHLARTHPFYRHVPISVEGPFELVVDRYRWLPFGLNGRGRAPGEIAVINSRGTVLDSERVEDVLSVRNVRWEEFKVHFDFDKDGKTYESELALEP